MAEMLKLDRIDINILAHLQENGRITNVELADAVGLSQSPCLQRVKRLEKAGYIARYRASLALNKITDHVIVFTQVTLQDHKREDFIKFEREIQRYETLTECHLVSGGYDYLLKFICRSISHYQEVIETILERNTGLEKYFSYVVIKSILNKENVPVKALLESKE